MFDVGDTVTLTASPLDAQGAPFDPDGLEVSITLPDGTDFTDDPTHPGVGSYKYEYVTEQVGRHVVTWASDEWAYSDVFNVWSGDPRFLFSLEDAKKFLGTSDSDDEDVRLYMAATTQLIEDIVGPVVPVAKTQVFDGGGTALLLNDLNVTVTGISVDGTLLNTDAYVVDSASGIVYSRTDQYVSRFGWGRQIIEVAYTTGDAVVPDNLIAAAQEWLRFLWQIGRQGNRPGFGDAPEAEYATDERAEVYRRVLMLCGSRRKATRPAYI